MFQPALVSQEKVRLQKALEQDHQDQNLLDQDHQVQAQDLGLVSVILNVSFFSTLFLLCYAQIHKLSKMSYFI